MSGFEVLSPREVPLGGLRAMTVRRTLPQRRRSLIGAWCFVDHYGPEETPDALGMVVPPHPHTGLQTVSWLFTGEIEHRDSAGNHAMVRPGELNLMTAGRGISHSEYSTSRALHGVQLWVALPDDARQMDPGFEHYAPPEVAGAGWRGRVFLGSLLGHTSPVRTPTPLVGGELSLEAGATLELPLRSDFEHGFLLDSGEMSVDGETLGRHDLGFVPLGHEAVTLRARTDCLLVVLGGRPLGEQIVMWWNFIGRSHDEVAGYRDEWEGLLDRGGRRPLHAPRNRTRAQPCMPPNSRTPG